MWNLSDNSALYCFILQLCIESRLHFLKDRPFGPVLTPNLQLCQIRLQTPIYPFILILTAVDYQTSIQIRFLQRWFPVLCLNFRAQYHTSPWASRMLHRPYTTHSHTILLLPYSFTIMALTRLGFTHLKGFTRLKGLLTNSMQLPLCYPRHHVYWHRLMRVHLRIYLQERKKKAVLK